MKILYITTIGSTMSFFKDFIKDLLNEGHIVEIATNENEGQSVPYYYQEWGCKVYNISTCRSPLNVGNIKAIKQIKKLAEAEKYDIIHCHTPLASIATRLGCRKSRKRGTKVIYTAHGFHFYKGAPIKNWILYYPIEKLCSYFTDIIITINKEDYCLAKEKMKANYIEYVPGVGINLQNYKGNDVHSRDEIRASLGIPNEAVLLLSVGELNANKNHITVIRAIAEMSNMYYIIAGSGELEHSIVNYIDSHNMSERVKLLGYRNDISKLCNAADVFIFPSFREGLAVSLMEAMASGLPVVCSEIRGNVDLIDNNGGQLFDPNSFESCRNELQALLKRDISLLGEYNIKKVKEFDSKKIIEIMKDIYETSVITNRV